MKKLALLAIVVAVAGVAPAQQTITETETTVRSTAPAPATERVTETNTETRVDSTGKTTVETTKYQERLRGAYRAAGVADPDIDRLVTIDMRARDAIAAGDKVKVKQYYQEQTQILQPQQVEKVRVYLKDNPVAVAPAPATATVTAPAPRVYTTYEYVPTMAGVKLDTPLGSVGLGVPTGGQTVETRTVVP